MPDAPPPPSSSRSISAALSQGLAAALAPGGPSAFGWGGKEKGGRAKTTATVTATKRRPFPPGARGGRSSAPTASTTHQTGASSPPAGVRKAPSIAGGRRTRPSSDTRAAPSIDRLRGGAAFPWWPFGAGAGGGASGGGTGGGTANPADEERILISEVRRRAGREESARRDGAGQRVFATSSLSTSPLSLPPRAFPVDRPHGSRGRPRRRPRRYLRPPPAPQLRLHAL